MVLKVGRSERARLAVPTHTGGTAGEPGAVSALLRAHRAIEVADLVEMTEVLAACQSARRPAGRRIGVITSSGGLAEMILDIAERADLAVPPLSEAARADIVARIGPITGDGNPLDAWGSGTFTANLPQALRLFDASPDHDIVVFCRDTGEDQPSTARIWCRPISTCSPRRPDEQKAALPAAHAAGDHGPAAGGATARTGSPWSAGCARGCRRSTGWRVSPAGQIHEEGGAAAMTEPVVLYEVDEQVGIITLNRPDKLNAISAELQHALTDAFAQGRRRPRHQRRVAARQRPQLLRRLRYRGEGRPAPTTGAATRHGARPPASQLEFEMAPWLMKKPVIAAVQGHVLGGGCELVMLCDLTIAADNATFGEPEVRFSSVGPAIVMPMIIGYKKARELLYFGDQIDAQTALSLGMVNRVVPLAELREASLRYAKRLSLISPEALCATKRAVNRGADAAGFRTALYAGLDVVGPLYATTPHWAEVPRDRRRRGCAGRGPLAVRPVQGVGRWLQRHWLAIGDAAAAKTPPDVPFSLPIASS